MGSLRFPGPTPPATSPASLPATARAQPAKAGHPRVRSRRLPWPAPPGLRCWCHWKTCLRQLSPEFSEITLWLRRK